MPRPWKRWSHADDAELKRQCESGVTFKKLNVPGHTAGSTRVRFMQLELRCVARKSSGRLGIVRSAAATEHPTVMDIHHAAVWFDAEGSCGYYDKNQTTVASVAQKDPEILWWFKRKFGGTVSEKAGSWVTYGARARGFLMTIYSLLTTRRKEQVKRALHLPLR